MDIWTPAHVFTGMLTRYLGFKPAVAVMVWATFEILENTVAEVPEVKHQIPTSGAETATNIIGDLIANTSGYALMNWWMKRHGL